MDTFVASVCPHSSDFGEICAFFPPFLHQLTMQSSLFEPGDLRPCPSYSRRRDRVNLGLLRSLYKGEGVRFSGVPWAVWGGVHVGMVGAGTPPLSPARPSGMFHPPKQTSQPLTPAATHSPPHRPAEGVAAPRAHRTAVPAGGQTPVDENGGSWKRGRVVTESTFGLRNSACGLAVKRPLRNGFGKCPTHDTCLQKISGLWGIFLTQKCRREAV